jgi:hypothetical protein
MTTLRTVAVTAILAGTVLLPSPGVAGAQSRTIEGDTIVVTATIEAIDHATRTLTLKDKDGIYETLQAGPEMKRFAELKVGDTITARYYDNVVVRLKKPGEPAVDVDAVSVTRNKGVAPGGTAATQRTITVTVTAMDAKTNSVTVNGPNGYAYSRRVRDKKTFAMLKVGDRLDMTWTEALLLSADAPKK